MNAPASTAAMRGVHPALSDMEDDGHRVVGLVQALMLMGFGAHMNDVPAEAILTLGEAMLGAAESVRDQWRGAIELTRTAETEAVSAADMARPPDPASLGRIRAIVHERLQAAEGGAVDLRKLDELAAALRDGERPAVGGAGPGPLVSALWRLLALRWHLPLATPAGQQRSRLPSRRPNC
jgi:hypothetical protein